MRHNPAPIRQCPARKSQSGFAIIAAIFLVVVLAALGGFMLTFSSAQHIASAQDVLGSRAYQAARAGMEWGAYQVKLGGTVNCNTSPDLASLTGDLAAFSVTVTCIRTAYTEGNPAATTAMYQITSTARSGTVGDITYVERKLTATISGLT